MMSSVVATPSIAQMPSPRVRLIVSALVIYHVVAVFWGPFAMPPQNSELSATVATVFRPYVDGLNLANGYRFFAPEPGPSHLVRYDVTLADGSHVKGVFPDKQEHFPRLLYHRYFMLSEFINTLDNPAADPARMHAFAKSYADHLAHEYDAQDVHLYLQRHYVPRMNEVRAGMRLSDKALYEERPLWSFKTGAPPAQVNMPPAGQGGPGRGGLQP